jgi:membrane-associated phospholipid phosphatase
MGMFISYAIHLILMLATTKTLKKLFSRNRPVGPKPDAENYRIANLRGLESNHSFPSGDTA